MLVHAITDTQGVLNRININKNSSIRYILTNTCQDVSNRTYHPSLDAEIGYGTNNFKVQLSLVSFAYFYDQVDFDPRYDTTVDGRIIYGQVNVKLFTVFKISGLPGLAMFHLKVLENSLLLQSYLRRLSRFSENFTTLSLMVLHSVGLI